MGKFWAKEAQRLFSVPGSLRSKGIYKWLEPEKESASSSHVLALRTLRRCLNAWRWGGLREGDCGLGESGRGTGFFSRCRCEGKAERLRKKTRQQLIVG